MILRICLFLHFFFVICCPVFASQPVQYTENISERVVIAGSSWDIGTLVYQPDDPGVADIIPGIKGYRLVFKKPGDLWFTVSLQDAGNIVAWRELVHVAEDASVVPEETLLIHRIIDLVNSERVLRSLVPLRVSPDLMDAAAVRAYELLDNCSHTRPDGSSCLTVLRDKGHIAGENIAGGSLDADDVFKDWMDSPGHKANILDPRYREIGVGCYRDGYSKYKRYWSQLFRG